MPPRLAIIFNPAAANGRAAKTVADLRASVTIENATWLPTTHPRHAASLAAKAMHDGHDVVVSCGGDGTLHEVANGLMQAPAEIRPRLGVVPVGNGNDFCASAGISLDLGQAVRVATTSERTRSLDVGALTSNGKTEFFTNTLGFGFDATVTIKTKGSRLSGQPMYVSAVLRTIMSDYFAPRYEIELDSAERVAGEYLMLTVGNGQREGGGFITTPAADIGDGRLDYLLFGKVSRAMMLRLIPEVMRGTQGRFKQCRLGQFSRMALRADRPIPIHTDGEIFASRADGVTHAEVEVRASALRLAV